MKIAVVTTLSVLEHKCAGQQENQRLKEALERQGAEAQCIAWDGPEHEWQGIDAMVIRTTWNYHLHIHAFCHFLERRNVQGCRCFNAPALVRWNIDKHYLAELSAAGVPVVATQFLRQSDPISSLSLPDEWQTAPMVLKPTVSASAHETVRFDSGRALLDSSKLAQLHDRHDLMIQPFQHRIAEGEVSLVLMGGRLQHAVRKVPAAGDFRVQGEYGGRVVLHEASQKEHALIAALLRVLPQRPDYARVDIVRDNQGEWALMELELIEPQLFFDINPGSADVLAHHVMASLSDH